MIKYLTLSLVLTSSTFGALSLISDKDDTPSTSLSYEEPIGSSMNFVSNGTDNKENVQAIYIFLKDGVVPPPTIDLSWANVVGEQGSAEYGQVSDTSGYDKAGYIAIGKLEALNGNTFSAGDHGILIMDPMLSTRDMLVTFEIAVNSNSKRTYYSTQPTAVPEPTTPISLAGASLLFIFRRRRH